MQWKLATAFGAGAIIASGIVYVSVKGMPDEKPAAVARVEEPQRVPVPQARTVQPAPRPEPELQPVAPAATPAPVPKPTAAPVHPAPAVRAKPSPFARHTTEPEKESPMVAQVETPAAPPAPAEAAPAPSAPAPVQQTPPPAPAPSAPPQPAPEPPSVAAPPTSQPPSQPEGRVPHTVTLAAGTLLAVRIGESVSSARNQVGDSFLATLERPLVIDGFIIAERGSRVEGRIVEAAQAGRSGGTSRLSIELVRLSTSDNQRIRIRTEPFKKEAGSSAGEDVAKIGAGAAIGAVIGAMAGGGKGAAIGAGAGTAAGAGAVLLTQGRPADIPVETRLSFRVQEPVTITEKLD